MDKPQPQLGALPDFESSVGAMTNREIRDELTAIANWQQVTTLTDDARQSLNDRLDEVRAEATIRGLIQ